MPLCTKILQLKRQHCREKILFIQIYFSLSIVALVTFIFVVVFNTPEHILVPHYSKFASWFQVPIATRFYHSKLPPFNTSMLTGDMNGRLGNQMFKFAALYCIAKHKGMVAVVQCNLTKVFKLDIPDSARQLHPHFQVFDYQRCCICDSNIEALDPDLDAVINGFIHCWKLFEPCIEDIRKQFVFDDETQLNAAKFLVNSSRAVSNSDLVFIGVHVRRGDMAKKHFADFGYTMPDVDYFISAMEYYKRQFSHILFVVCSDDMNWTLDILPTLGVNASFASCPGRNMIEDLAILSQCNHTIMTVGTFGWWAAWLAGGQVIYSKKYPRDGSPLAKQFYDKYDYFYPEWIGL